MQRESRRNATNDSFWKVVTAAWVCFALGLVGALRLVGQIERAPLDAEASDPLTLRWMVGSPPPPTKVIRFADGSHYRFPQTRWSFSNMRQFIPSRVVARGTVTELPRAQRADIDAVRFQALGRSEPMTWAESLMVNYTDGILVLHKGRVVYERYFGALTPAAQHIAFSVSKSFVATIAATLISEGTLDERASRVRRERLYSSAVLYACVSRSFPNKIPAQT